MVFLLCLLSAISFVTAASAAGVVFRADRRDHLIGALFVLVLGGLLGVALLQAARLYR